MQVGILNRHAVHPGQDEMAPAARRQLGEGSQGRGGLGHGIWQLAGKGQRFRPAGCRY